MFANPDELRERAMLAKKEKEEVAAAAESSKPSAVKTSGGDTPAADPGADPASAAASASDESEEQVQTPPVNTDGDGDGDNHERPPPVMSTEQVEEFFLSTIERLTSPEEREIIKSKVTAELRIPAILISIQHDQLERMGVSKEDGQASLDRYMREVAANEEDAHQRMDDFTHTCQRTFIEVLREMEPTEEEIEAKLTASQIMEFFEACDTLLALPETKQSLRKEYLETNKPPDDTIVAMQRRMLRTLGFSPDHGVACLNSFSTDYPDDEKLQIRLRQFMRCASMARQEAILGKEELTKRMQMQQAAAMKEHKMAMELSALDDDGLADLTKRVAEMQRKHAMAVMTLTTQEERLAYIKGIPANEQWEISKVKMLTRNRKMAEDGLHELSQGNASTGHGHGEHGRGGPLPQPPPQASRGGHSHKHEHGGHCSHDHSHAHSS